MHKQMLEGCSKPRNLDNFTARRWAAEFCELVHGIWQNLLQKTVGFINGWDTWADTLETVWGFGVSPPKYHYKPIQIQTHPKLYPISFLLLYY